MGQRSQIYVRFTSLETGKKYLIARYFGWNYGERMVSRVRHTIDFIDCQLYATTYKEAMIKTAEFEKKLVHIMETNFDYTDVVLSRNILRDYEEYFKGEPFADSVFYGQDNNDGQAFIDVYVVDNGNVVIKYAFAESTDGEEPLTPYGYLQMDMGEHWKERLDNEEEALCEANVKALGKYNLLSEAELKEFRNYDYTQFDVSERTAQTNKSLKGSSTTETPRERILRTHGIDISVPPKHDGVGRSLICPASSEEMNRLTYKGYETFLVSNNID